MGDDATARGFAKLLGDAWLAAESEGHRDAAIALKALYHAAHCQGDAASKLLSDMRALSEKYLLAVDVPSVSNEGGPMRAAKIRLLVARCGELCAWLDERPGRLAGAIESPAPDHGADEHWHPVRTVDVLAGSVLATAMRLGIVVASNHVHGMGAGPQGRLADALARRMERGKCEPHLVAQDTLEALGVPRAAAKDWVRTARKKE